MQIEQEVSSVADSAGATPDSLGATFNIRTVNNTVLVDSGETVVVGGLLDKSNSSWRAACRSRARSRWWGAVSLDRHQSEQA